MRDAVRLKEVAYKLIRQGHDLLAQRKYGRILDLLGRISAFASNARQVRAQKELRKHCLVNKVVSELRLEVYEAARATAEELIVEDDFSVRSLTLRGRATLQAGDPQTAKKDFLKALELDPRCKRAKQLLVAARRELRKQRRAALWFDGKGVEGRSSAAVDARVCGQCQQLQREGLDEEAVSAGKYLCRSCWECWRKIRRSQEKELQKRVEKATYSDYSTHTDELPSLDEAPKEWDSNHPMWSRDCPDRPDWQLEHLSPEEQRKVIDRSRQRKASAVKVQQPATSTEAEGRFERVSRAAELLKNILKKST
eukprot:TRINITY_DN14582_c0_g2_i1.p1 TRINITY_DN14582_c0_g2~~TRINITY_DN14582_c0_g2_i1.p1  ORF type:complete len:310 (-),score=60.46 TRINITY_DN14582_c0_g2_i1:69-998(-)